MSDPFNPYKTQHEVLSGPGDARPTALQVVQDNGRTSQWAGFTCLVTGGTSGIGPETVRALHATDADVFFTARDIKKAEQLISDLRKTSPGKGRLEVIEVELGSISSVKTAAKDFLKRSSGLNVLINNAGKDKADASVPQANPTGIMAAPRQLTVDGFESQFAINHLAHFTLTAILLPTLIASSRPEFKSRVINVSSSSHRYSSIHWDDINLENYDPLVSYGQSKTANIWHSNYIDRVYGAKGVHSLSLHPGGIWTNLTKHIPEEALNGFRADVELNKNMKSAEQGAATSLWAAVARVWEGKGGKYLADCTIAAPGTDLTSTMSSEVGPDAYNEEGENRLWDLSLKMTGVTVP